MAVLKYAKPEQYLKRSQGIMRNMEGKLGLRHTELHEITMPQLQKKPVHLRVFHTLAYSSRRMGEYLDALSRNCGAPEVCRKVGDLKKENERLDYEHTRLALGVHAPHDLARAMHDECRETARHFVNITRLLKEHPELKEKYKEFMLKETERKKAFLEETAKKDKARKEALERLMREYESKKS